MNRISVPLIVFCVSGELHLIYLNWSINSLLQQGYEKILVIVSSKKEQDIVHSWFPRLETAVVAASSGEYPAFSHKPFALSEWVDRGGARQLDGPIVICDADILWKADPTTLFRRFVGQCWVHKITAVDPNDYNIPIEKVPKSNIGLRTILNYGMRKRILRYPNFIVNAGLFMLEKNSFICMLETWMEKILMLPPREMLMSEALMSLTYAEMGLAPASDEVDIKHLNKQQSKSSSHPILSFIGARAGSVSDKSGYEVATHYYGDQRAMLHEDAVTLAFDPNGLSAQAIRLQSWNRWKKRVALLRSSLRFTA